MSKTTNLNRLCGSLGFMEILVREYQSARGLAVDGDPGPITTQTLREDAGYLRLDKPDFGKTLLRVAQGEVGKGETAGDNKGPDIARYLGGVDGGAWCAGFVSWCIDEAASMRGEDSPVERTAWARSLFSRALKAGQAVNKPAAGDLVLFERGAAGGTAHVGIVESANALYFESIEGNVGRFPAKVKRVRHKFTDDNLLGFARL